MKLPHSQSKGFLLKLSVLFLFCLALGALWIFQSPPRDEADMPGASTNRPAGIRPNQERSEQSGPAPADVERFLSLERRQKEAEESIWKTEILSRIHEDTWIQFWDVLRYAENPEELMGSFPVGSLYVGGWSEPEYLGATGIQRFLMNDPAPGDSQLDWKNLVSSYRKQGFVLLQSEWRHPRFIPDQGNSAARSHIRFSLHLANTNRHDRIAVDGKFEVLWEPLDPNPSVPALPREIRLLNAEIIRDSNPPAFQKVFGQALVPDLNPVLVDPLILYDLNGDGLSEIIFGSKNRVYWNRGNGRLEMKTLVDQLPEMTLTSVVADFDGDANADFLCADRRGLLLFKGDHLGMFPQTGIRSELAGDPMFNPYVLTCGDIDRDGDLDVWCAQYKMPYEAGQMPTPYYDANDGFASHLWVNDGEGRFVEKTKEAGLSLYQNRRTYSASFVDLDEDGDLDLVNVSDFAGLDAYQNHGDGTFKLATQDWFGEGRAFGMAHTMADYNGDGYYDLLMVGMHSHVAERLDHLGLGPEEHPKLNSNRALMSYGNRLYFYNGKKYDEAKTHVQLARTGWSWGASSFDWDNDGDLDIYIVNGHKSRATARDYERQFWCHDIYSASSDPDPAWDLFFKSTGRKLYGDGYSYGGYEKNRFLLNLNGKRFVNVAHALGLSMETDGRNLVSDDLDGDGKVDLVWTYSTVWPRSQQGFEVYKNMEATVGNWIGFRLREEGGGFSPVGATVRLTTSKGVQIKRFMTGDSYRSQHSNTAHFGLGELEEVEKVEVTWVNGTTRTYLAPEINTYHALSGRN